MVDYIGDNARKKTLFQEYDGQVLSLAMSESYSNENKSIERKL